VRRTSYRLLADAMGFGAGMPWRGLTIGLRSTLASG